MITIRLRLWVRRRIRTKFALLVWGTEKTATYIREMRWLKQYVPLRYNLCGSTGIEKGISIKRVDVSILETGAQRKYRPYSEMYLVNKDGHLIAEHGSSMFARLLKRRRTVYETFCRLGGKANLVKYIICISFGSTKDKNAGITIYKFPAGVMPLDYVAQIFAEYDARVLADKREAAVRDLVQTQHAEVRASDLRLEVIHEIAKIDGVAA